MVGLHIASLAVSIESAVALFDAGWVPGAIVMEQVSRGRLEVEAFGGRIGS